MNSPTRRANTADAQFVRVVAAEPRTVATVRSEFTQWIRTHLSLDEERVSDIVLAVNEALANAAEFAYRDFPEAGTIAIEARHRADTGTLTVSTADRGVWLAEDPVRSRTRGRGIPLMRMLSDDVTIDRGSAGTRVRLRFDHCAALMSDA